MKLIKASGGWTNTVLLCALSSLFLGLRLADSIDWKWYWIAAPLLAPIAVIAVLFTILVVIKGVQGACKAVMDELQPDETPDGPRCLDASRAFASEIEDLAVMVDDLLVSARARTCGTTAVLSHLYEAADSLDDAARRMSLVADDRSE